MINEFIETNLIRIRKACRYVCQTDKLNYYDLENEAIAVILERFDKGEINEKNLRDHASSVIYFASKEAQRRLNMALREHSKRSKRPLVTVIRDEPIKNKYDRNETVLSSASDGIDLFDNIGVLTERETIQKFKRFLYYVCPVRENLRRCIDVYFDWLENPKQNQLEYVGKIFPKTMVSSFRTLVHGYKRDVIEQIKTTDVSDCYNRYLLDDEYEIAIKTDKSDLDVYNCLRIALDLDLVYSV